MITLLGAVVITSLTNSHASPAADSKNIMVRVVVPPKVEVRIASSSVSSAQLNDDVCLIGSGFGQFRVHERSGSKVPKVISDYSKAYAIKKEGERCLNIHSLITRHGRSLMTTESAQLIVSAE